MTQYEALVDHAESRGIQVIEFDFTSELKGSASAITSASKKTSPTTKSSSPSTKSSPTPRPASATSSTNATQITANRSRSPVAAPTMNLCQWINLPASSSPIAPKTSGSSPSSSAPRQPTSTSSSPTTSRNTASTPNSTAAPSGSTRLRLRFMESEGGENDE